MARLNTSLHSSLTEANLNSLFNKKIYTITNFLDCDAKMITKITNLTFKEVLDIRKQITNKYSAKVQNGANYYSYLLKSSVLTPTNINSLDNILDGGFFSGSIYEFCGLSATGKTQLCLTLTINVSQKYEMPVYYIDTKRDFSTTRLQSILEAKKCKEGDIAHILNRIKVKQVTDQYELISALFDIKKEFENGLKCPIIIIDSLPAVFYHTGDYNNTLTLINHFVNTIRYLSVEYHTAIIVTNIIIKNSSGNSSNSSNINIKPGLGNYWNHVPNTRILFSTTTEQNTCKLTILKSTSVVECGKHCNVVITDFGVVEKIE